MKPNQNVLPASCRQIKSHSPLRRALPTVLTAVLLLVTATIAITQLTGCSSTPYNWESKFYDITTNYTPVINWTTNTVTRTNVVERVVTTTNVVEATGAIQITMTPEKHYTVMSDPVVTVSTNLLVTYTYTANTNAAAVTGTAAGIANLVVPGSGGLISLIGAGIWGLWASLRSRKWKNAAAGLSQGIEVYGEVTKALGPTGTKVDAEVKAWLQKHQAQTGTLTAVLDLLNTTVDNEDARKAAQTLKEFITRP